MVTVAIDLPLRLWLRLRQEARQRAYQRGELEPETISPIIRDIVEESLARRDQEQGDGAVGEDAAPGAPAQR
jgi:hypothetical protein